jgi:predicted Rossmann fold flavoprotein
MAGLSGVSLDTSVSVGRRSFREALLFTHRGLSGPAVLQISSYWQEGPVSVDLLPGQDAGAFLLERKQSRPKAGLASVLAEVLPARLAGVLAGSVEGRMADVPNRVLAALAGQVSGWAVTPNGTEGFAKAEVTLGGVDTRDLSSRTMAANDVPGLFVIGEAVDVTGWLGGYNFQWAWASGWCAGEAV